MIIRLLEYSRSNRKKMRWKLRYEFGGIISIRLQRYTFKYIYVCLGAQKYKKVHFSIWAKIKIVTL